MAFRFRLNEPTLKEFRRIGVEQIDRALGQLASDGHPETAVHETRKCLKRARALLRLVEPGLGDAQFRTENARLRDIAALLAPARDRHILLDTVTRLECLPGRTAHASLAAIKAILVDDLEQQRTVGDGKIGDALAKLETARKRLRRLKLTPADFSTIARGLEQSYRRGLRAFRAAYASGQDDSFHEWRKTVQHHWRHMALLSRAWPDYFEARLQAARALSQILGEDHDLSLVAAYARSVESSRLPRTHVREIARLTRARQKELRLLARPRGKQLFVEGARGHSRRVAELWAAAEEMGEAEDADASGGAPALEKPQAAATGS